MFCVPNVTYVVYVSFNLAEKPSVPSLSLSTQGQHGQKWPPWPPGRTVCLRSIYLFYWLSSAQQERRSLAIVRVRHILHSVILGKWLSPLQKLKWMKSCILWVLLCLLVAWKNKATPNGPVNRIVTARNYEFFEPKKYIYIYIEERSLRE